MNSPAREAQPLTDQIVHDVCKAVAELPDRNSPEDWPEAMLVTHDELSAIVRAALATHPAPVAPTEPVWPEPAAHRVMAFGRTQHLVVRADVAAEIADKQQNNAREAGLDSKACVEELFTAAQVRAMLATPAPSAAPAQPTEPTERLRSDCPPTGYPNDKTRCAPCPRRAAQPVAAPARWSVSLDEEAIELLRNTIGTDEEPNLVTLGVGEVLDDDGKPEHGLYVFLTEYPEEGVILLTELPRASVPAAPPAAQPVAAPFVPAPILAKLSWAAHVFAGIMPAHFEQKPYSNALQDLRSALHWLKENSHPAAPQPPVAHPCTATAVVAHESAAVIQEAAAPQPESPRNLNGMQPGETVAHAAERWAQWCERRSLSMLPEFLRLMARAWESAVAAPQPASARPFVAWARPSIFHDCDPVLTTDAETAKQWAAEGRTVTKMVPAQPASAQVAEPVALPPAYMLAKLAMVMPLFQEARDALTALTEQQRVRHGVSKTLADRMDIAGTYSLDDWRAAAPGAVPFAQPAVSGGAGDA